MSSLATSSIPCQSPTSGVSSRPNRDTDPKRRPKADPYSYPKPCLRSVKETKADMRTQDTNPIGRIFGGHLLSEIRCTECDYRSCTFDHFQDLSIEVIPS